MGKTSLVVLAGLMLLLCDARVEAYINPGSGSMLVQLLLGGVAGLIVLVNFGVRRLLGRLGIGRGRDANRPGRG